MQPGGEGERRAAAGEAGAADFSGRERAPQDGARWRVRWKLERATVCRAGFAGRGTPFARSTERRTLASDLRRSLGSVTVVVAALLAGCGGDRGAGRDELAARLDEVDRRLTLLEKRVESTRALGRHLRSVERRLASAETRLAQGALAGAAAQAPSPPDSGSPTEGRGPGGAWSNPSAAGRGPQAGIPPAATALLEEFNAKLRAIEEQYRAAPTSAEHRQALSELYQWYRERASAAWYPERPGARAAPGEGK